jgi:hypothetical protein
MIGILGPTCDYSIYGNDLRATIRRFGLGDEGIRGSDLLQRQLTIHVAGWRRRELEEYKIRKGLKWKSKRINGPQSAHGHGVRIDSRLARARRDVRIPQRQHHAIAERNEDNSDISSDISSDSSPDSVSDSSLDSSSDSANGEVDRASTDAESEKGDDETAAELNRTGTPVPFLEEQFSSSHQVGTTTPPSFVDEICASKSVEPARPLTVRNPTSPIDISTGDSHGIDSNSNFSREYSPEWLGSDVTNPQDYQFSEFPASLTPNLPSTLSFPFSPYASPGSPQPELLVARTSRGSEKLADFNIPDENAPPGIETQNIRPISSISLSRFISYLLMARQKGRLTRLQHLWKIHPLGGDTGSYKCFEVFFEGQVIHGMRMIQVPYEDVDRDRKICVLGCKKHGVHRWVSNPE